MKAIVATDQTAGTTGLRLDERPHPAPAIGDVVVRVMASGFVPTELSWPSTWVDRQGRDRTPSVPGHELAGIVARVRDGRLRTNIGTIALLDEAVAAFNPGKRLTGKTIIRTAPAAGN